MSIYSFKLNRRIGREKERRRQQGKKMDSKRIRRQRNNMDSKRR